MALQACDSLVGRGERRHGTRIALSASMRSPPKQLSRILCGLSFLVGAFTAEPALRAEVSVAPDLSVGALLGVHLPELSVRPTLGVGATCWWKPTARLDLGIQATLTLTSIPYGNNDGEPVIGNRGGYNPAYLEEDLTALPRLAFAWRYALSDATSLRGLLGATFLLAGEMKEFALVPFPTAGIAVETKLGHSGSLKLRAGVEYILFVIDFNKGMVAPSVGLAWN